MLIWVSLAFHPELLSLLVRFFKVSAFQEGLMARTTAVLSPPGRSGPFSGWFSPEPGLCTQGWGERFREGEEKENEKGRKRERGKEKRKEERGKGKKGKRKTERGGLVLNLCRPQDLFVRKLCPQCIKYITIPH